MINSKTLSWIGSLLLVVVSPTVHAASPLDDLIDPLADETACFTRVYDDAHLRRIPAQKTRSMTVLLKYERQPPDSGVSGLALYIGIGLVQRGDPLPFFAIGGCQWDERANRDTSDKRMIPALKKDEAAACTMSAQPDVFESVSAEEGGFLMLDRGRDRNTLMVYLDDSLTMVKRANRGNHLTVKFGADDRVFMLRRTNERDCAAVEEAVTEPEPGVQRR